VSGGVFDRAAERHTAAKRLAPRGFSRVPRQIEQGLAQKGFVAGDILEVAGAGNFDVGNDVAEFPR